MVCVYMYWDAVISAATCRCDAVIIISSCIIIPVPID